MNELTWAKINWSPFATNILDAGEFILCDPLGNPVDMHRSGMGFILNVGGQHYETSDNLQMSYWMNQHAVGGVRK